MTTALWGVLLLTLAGGAHATDNGVGARAPQPDTNPPITNSRAHPTQSRSGSTATPAQQSKSAGRSSENYKADMAECHSMIGTQRSACEHEMHVARAQGLYRE